MSAPWWDDQYPALVALLQVVFDRMSYDLVL